MKMLIVMKWTRIYSSAGNNAIAGYKCGDWFISKESETDDYWELFKSTKNYGRFRTLKSAQQAAESIGAK